MSNAGSVQVVLSANATGFSAALTEAQRNLDKLSGKTKEFGSHTVSGMQAASASIRLLENPLGNNIRAIERLISQSKVLSSVMKAAFPLVGAIAIGSMIAKLGTEVGEFITEVNGMPKAIEQGFAALNLSTKTATDEIVLSTDKMKDHLAILEHKPATNGAKIAADEIALAADKAAERIINANNKLNELLSKNHLSGFAVLLGKQGTGDRENAAKKFGSQADDAAYDLANATTPQQTAAAQAKLAKVQADQLKEAQDDLKKRQDVAAGPDAKYNDDSANMNIDKGVITNILNQRKQAQAESDQAVTEGQVKTAEDAKANAEKANEAAKKAAEQRLKNYEDELKRFDAIHGRDLQGDILFWQQKLSVFAKGSSEFDSVREKFDAALAARNEKNAETIKEQRRKDLESSATDAEGPELANRADEFFAKMGQQKTGDAYAGYADSNALALVKNRNDEQEQSAKIQDAMGSSITKVAAAAALAALHTKTYNEQLAILQSNARNAAAQLAADPTNKGLQKADEEAKANLDTAGKTRTIQVRSDNDAQYGRTTSGLVGFTDALDDVARSSKDWATTMSELTTSSLQSVNSEIVKAISGQRTNWGNMGAGIFRNVAGAGLQHAEGSVLSAFGFGGGKMGTQSNPMWTKSADAIGGAFGSMAHSAGSFLSHLFGGGQGSSSSSTSSTSASSSPGSLLSGFGPLLMTGLPFLASGGPLQANMPAIIGERGPELWMPSQNGTVIPNHKLGSMGTGDTHHNWYINASNATDPAQTKAQVQRGIMQAAPQIIAASHHADREAQKRRPSTQR